MKTTQTCAVCEGCTQVPGGRKCSDEADAKVERPPSWPWIIPGQRCDKFRVKRRYERGAAPQ